MYVCVCIFYLDCNSSTATPNYRYSPAVKLFFFSPFFVVNKVSQLMKETEIKSNKAHAIAQRLCIYLLAVPANLSETPSVPFRPSRAVCLQVREVGRHFKLNLIASSCCNYICCLFSFAVLGFLSSTRLVGKAL